MLSLQANDKVALLFINDNERERDGTVTEIDTEGYVHISLDGEPGRARIRANGDKIEYHNNYILKIPSENSRFNTINRILKVRSKEDCIFHHPKAIMCSQHWSNIKCSECKNICCNICNLCEIKDCKQCCYQCLNNDNLFEKYRINRVLCSFCNIGIHPNKKENFCTECSSQFCRHCGASSIQKCTNCNEYITKQIYKTSVNECLEDVDIYLIDMIASYCIGYIVECNNKHCLNMISINNDIDFENNMDSFGSTIHKYCIEDKYIHISSNMNGWKIMHKLQEGYWRIFCAECTESKLMRCNRDICPWRWCSNPCYCNNYDSNQSCLNHAFCGQYSNYYWSLISNDIAPKCKYRNDIYEDRGISYCDVCKTDFDEICQTLDVNDVDEFYRYCDYTQYKLSKAKKRRLRKRKLKQSKSIRPVSHVTRI